jgi:methylamine dehydrogenase accessory protein MauD
MNLLLLISSIVSWLVLLTTAFLLLGVLRALGVLRWRLEELEAKTPTRRGRDGLPPGKKAPDFTLPSVAGSEASLHDCAGRKVLLVLVQGGCSPCHLVVPELNKLQGKGDPRVLAVFNGSIDAAGKWAAQVKAEFPVLAQDQLAVSRRYQVFATPFAFLIDEQGVIRSKGIVNNGQHIGYVLAGRGSGANGELAEETGAEQSESKASDVPHSTKEVGHV